MLKFIILACLFNALSIAPFFAQGDEDCAATLLRRRVENQRFRTDLKRGNWASLHETFVAEVQRVSREIHELPEPDLRALGSHWSARYTGEVISSSFKDLVAIADALPFAPGQTFIDLGSGHGFPALIIGALHPELRVLGYDVVAAKVASANRLAHRLNLNNVKFVQQDPGANDFTLPAADYYYLFNPANPPVVKSLARKILKLSGARNVQVILFGQEGNHTYSTFAESGFVHQKRWTDHNFSIFEKSSPFNSFASRFADLIRLGHEAAAAIEASDWDELRDLRTHEAYLTNALKPWLLRQPAELRRDFLRFVDRRDLLVLRDDLIDVLFGLDVPSLDLAIDRELRTGRSEAYRTEDIWYAPGGGQQTKWASLSRWLERLELDGPSKIVDFGTGLGRLGLLIGLYYPEVTFKGFELVRSRVDAAGAAAQINGFLKVSYHEQNMADHDFELPTADHYYLFNPTNPNTSEILARALRQRALERGSLVHIRFGFRSTSFFEEFHAVRVEQDVTTYMVDRPVN